MCFKDKLKSSELLKTRYSLWGAIIILLAIGLVMIYSASGMTYISSEAHGYDSMFLFKKQLVFILLGLLACFVIQFLDYRMLYRISGGVLIIGLFAIGLLKTPLGITVKGATRWLNILGVQFQVAELVKICVIILVAYMIQKYAKRLKKVQLVVFIWLLGGVPAVLLFVISNDLSSSMVLLGITFGITFVYTNRAEIHIAALVVVAMIAIIYVMKIANNMPTPEQLDEMSFRVGRIAAWLDPERYAEAQGYQTLQALYAIGRGGFFGQGLGNSIQKISAIPEAQNDMIFSIICEELGLLGALMILCLYGYLIWLLFKIAFMAKDLFGSALVTGVLIHIALQCFINIGVNTNLLPNTGIGLPFISYGGTAVFCLLVELGVVLSVCRGIENRRLINVYHLRKA